MSSPRRRSHHPYLLLALGAALFVAAPSLVGAQGGCPASSVQVDVTVDYEAKTISVSDASVTIYVHEGEGRPGKVCWVAEGLAKGHTLEIAAKAEQPAAFTKSSFTIRHPAEGAYDRHASSGSPKSEGEWTTRSWSYGLSVSPAGSVEPLDPEVLIDKRPSP